MIKKNKWTLIASSIVILIPMLFGIFADKILPEEIAIHFGLDGVANGFGSPSLVFVILPIILLAIHWLCVLATMIIDKNANQNKILMRVALWIIPVISISSCAMIFVSSLGYDTNMSAFMFVVFGILFIVIGNYMPKTTRNRTMGIKIKWTLANDENWNATHRFAGKVYFIVGFLSLLMMPLPMKMIPYALVAILLSAALLPTIYSYLFYKKQITDGKVTKEDYDKGYTALVKNKSTVWITVAVIAIVLCVIMFLGKTETVATDTGISVEATFWSDLELSYEDIDSAEYRENGVDGERVSGFGSAKLLLGIFRNDEFGLYTRYTYTGNKPCIVLRVDDDVIVIGTEEASLTKEIYDRIAEEIS